jgi:hypothetical protein
MGTVTSVAMSPSCLTMTTLRDPCAAAVPEETGRDGPADDGGVRAVRWTPSVSGSTNGAEAARGSGGAAASSTPRAIQRTRFRIDGGRQQTNE